jgi:hypothetical protein
VTMGGMGTYADAASAPPDMLSTVRTNAAVEAAPTSTCAAGPSPAGPAVTTLSRGHVLCFMQKSRHAKNLWWLLAAHLHRPLAPAQKACTRDRVLHNTLRSGGPLVFGGPPLLS